MFSLSLPSIDTSRECPYTKSSFRNTSLWSLFKQNADFIVPSDDDEALNSVLAQNVELVNIFNHFKDSYVSFLKTLELKFERCFDPFIVQVSIHALQKSTILTASSVMKDPSYLR